ncbi:GNAT family N-acetyltransferase, partial [Streptococcus parasanguinis]
YRKCGLGKAMLLAALRSCKENGVTRAYVEPFDVWRETFYASAGFKTYGKMGIWTLSEQI